MATLVLQIPDESLVNKVKQACFLRFFAYLCHVIDDFACL